MPRSGSLAAGRPRISPTEESYFEKKKKEKLLNATASLSGLCSALLSGVQGAALSGSDYAGCRRFYLKMAVRACRHSRFNSNGAGVVGICTVTVAAVGGENRRMLPSERSAGAPFSAFCFHSL